MAEKLNPVMDYDEHNKTYELFIKMFKYGTVILRARAALHGLHAALMISQP